MLLSFEMTTLTANSWNGNWSGADRYYAIVRRVGNSKTNKYKASRIVEIGRFTYRFSDGWNMKVDVRQVDSKEAAKIRNRSDGFCGYDWMVASIIKKLKITVLNEGVW